MQQPTIHIFYHDNCLDGLGGYHFLAKTLSKSFSTIIPHAINYGYAEDRVMGEVDANSVVYFVDFTPRLETAEHLLKTVRQLIILDHHVSAEDTLISLKHLPNHENIFIQYTTRLSGAEIAARYEYIVNELGDIFSSIGEVQSDHILAKYLGIRDRWDTSDLTEKYRADCLHAYLSAIGWDVEDSANIMSIGDDESVFFSMVGAGHLLLEDKRHQANKAVNSSIILHHEGCHIALGFITAALGSIYGETFYNRYPEEVAVAVGIVYSMRSNSAFLSIRCKHGEYARRLAEHLYQTGFAVSGGGHNCAAGAKIEHWSTDKQNQLLNITRQFIFGN